MVLGRALFFQGSKFKRHHRISSLVVEISELGGSFGAILRFAYARLDLSPVARLDHLTQRAENINVKGWDLFVVGILYLARRVVTIFTLSRLM